MLKCVGPPVSKKSRLTGDNHIHLHRLTPAPCLLFAYLTVYSLDSDNLSIFYYSKMPIILFYMLIILNNSYVEKILNSAKYSTFPNL